MRRHPVAPGIRLLDDALLRCAAWPIETLDAFRAPELAACATAVLKAEGRLYQRREELVARIHSAVALVRERSDRAVLLAIKRRIHSGVEPFDPPPPRLAAALDPVDPLLTGALLVEHRHRLRLKELRARLSRRYGEVFAGQRAALRSVTSEAQFRRALTLSNPELASRWGRYLARLEAGTRSASHTPSAVEVPSRARTVRLEMEVFHYLVRGATRPTPNGLWAGVAMIRPGDRLEDASAPIGPRLRCRRVPPRHWVTVDLRPFAAVVGSLRESPRYRVVAPVRLAQSAYRVGPVWYFRPPGRPKHVWATVSCHPMVELLLDAFADGRALPLRPLVEALSLELAGKGEREPLERLLTRAAGQLVELGLLSSSLTLPAAADDAWAALNGVTPQLLASDRGQWEGAVDRLRQLCARLSDELDELDPVEVDRQRELAEQEVQRLYDWACVGGPVPQPVLRVDLRCGFALTGSPAFAEAARDAVAETLAFYAADGGPEVFRRRTMEALLGREGQVGRQLLEIARTRGPDADPAGGGLAHARVTALLGHLGSDASRRRQTWRRRLKPLVTNGMPYRIALRSLESRPCAGPGGTVIMAVTAAGMFRVEWGRPQPLAPASRFEPLLAEGEEPSPLASAARDWLGSWERAGVEPVEVVGADPLNPSVAVRPVVTRTRLDTTAAGQRIAEVSVGVTPGEARPWLCRKGSAGRLVPVYTSTATVGLEDPCSAVLFRLAMGHGWEFVGRRLVPELVGLRGIPRIELPGGTVVSPARWWLEADAVEELLGLRGVDRYLAWRRQVGRLGLPERTWVALDPDPARPLQFLRTDSPLDVDCLFRRIAWPFRLELVEVHGDPDEWPVQDEEGQHYASEVALTWADDTYWDTALALERPGDGWRSGAGCTRTARRGGH
jgi:Lantibiotic dehydratase, N terminus